jgi:predicted phosphodiesterase
MKLTRSVERTKNHIFLPVVCFFVFLLPLFSEAFSLGIVTDIHAGGSKEVKRSDINILHPSRYCENLDIVKKSGVDYILTLGDNTLNGKSSEAKKVLNCLKGYKVLWTKGNHDKEEAWQYFKTPNYYSKQIGSWKIIVMDSSKIDPSKSGGFLDDQLAWLEKELAGNENVLISMHHNIFTNSLLFPNITYSSVAFPDLEKPIEITAIYPVYEKFKEILEASGKVKYVYSGHVHTSNKCTEVNGINYCSVPSVSLESSEGYFVRLDLE